MYYLIYIYVYIHIYISYIHVNYILVSDYGSVSYCLYIVVYTTTSSMPCCV